MNENINDKIKELQSKIIYRKDKLNNEEEENLLKLLIESGILEED